VRAGGLHYCTAAPLDARGELAAPSDAPAQAELALRDLASKLGEARLRMQDVSMLSVSLADVRLLSAFDEAFRRHFRPPYPARSVSGVPLARAGQLVELESTAAYGGGQPVGAAASGELASPGMLAGDWLFLGARADGEPPGAALQTRRAWEGVAATVEAAGMTRADVVRTTNVLTDWRHYGGFNSGYGAFVEPPYPPRATVHAALADPRACVQIEAIAHRQGRDATILEASGASAASGAR
jgi:2-iminobutanoate/2-iminopropanoate deaminase